MENGPPKKLNKWWSIQSTSLLGIYVLVFALGISDVFSYENSVIQAIFSIGLAIFATIWVIHDRWSQGGNIAYVLRIIILVTCPFSVIVYLIYSRGLPGIYWAIVNFVATALVFNIAYLSTYYLVYFSGFWNLYDPIHLEY
jgi:hypothetical protein